MNLLSDLSNELAIAILVDENHNKKISRSDGISLIEKVRNILEPISDDKKAAEPIYLSHKVSKSSNN